MTTSITPRSIADRLGAPIADMSVLDHCSEDELSRIDAAVVKLLASEDRAVDEGLTEALRFVPRPVRNRAKVLLFGGDHD